MFQGKSLTFLTAAKKESILIFSILLIAILLVSCTPAAANLIPTGTTIPTVVATSLPTLTSTVELPTPTSTPVPTAAPSATSMPPELPALPPAVQNQKFPLQKDIYGDYIFLCLVSGIDDKLTPVSPDVTVVGALTCRYNGGEVKIPMGFFEDRTKKLYFWGWLPIEKAKLLPVEAKTDFRLRVAWYKDEYGTTMGKVIVLMLGQPAAHNKKYTNVAYMSKFIKYGYSPEDFANTGNPSGEYLIPLTADAYIGKK